jgi:hypothetical protein
MKKLILNIAIGLFAFSSTLAQNENCPTLKLKDGMQLIYETQTPPVAMYKFQGEYYKKSPKEQQKIDAKFEKENPWTTDIQTNKIALSNNADGSVEINSTVTRSKQPTVVSQYRSFCTNDTMVSRPGFVSVNNGVTTDFGYYNVTKAADGTENGFIVRYEKRVPNKLEVGQKLNDEHVMFIFTETSKVIKYPAQELVSSKIISHGSYNSYGQWNELYTSVENKFKTVEKQMTNEITGTTEIFCKNRVIKEKKDVVVSEQTYTAYLLYEETWTGNSQLKVKSDNPFVQKNNQKFADKMAQNIADVLKKSLNANDDGYVVTTSESWIIPGIGSYAMTSYDAFKRLVIWN